MCMALPTLAAQALTLFGRGELDRGNALTAHAIGSPSIAIPVRLVLCESELHA